MTPVASPLIAPNWPRLWALLRHAVERGGEHTEASVLAALQHGGMVLWVDSERVADAKAAIVTAWCDYPAGRVGFVLFAGGENAQVWAPVAAEVFSAWAKGMGCKELRLVGRKGWAKLLGMTPTEYTYSRSL